MTAIWLCQNMVTQMDHKTIVSKTQELRMLSSDGVHYLFSDAEGAEVIGQFFCAKG